MKLLAERLRKVFRLSSAERIVLAQAWGLFFLVALMLRVLPFKRLLVLIDKRGSADRQIFPLPRRGRGQGEGETCAPLTPSPRPSPWKGEGDASLSASRVAWLVEVAGRYAPVNATCLKQALVLSWILGRRGIATSVRIGVARHNGALRGHAWLERQGEMIPGFAATEEYELLMPRRETQ